ncbi:unnamed protein product [Candidula unifasciata]|uniref:Uncharacterized protein n=1 Tax=Candidula unifasciata TaxID=100452 RepID=A0A8S3ZRV5_9EUPU|nr:unnamed protein product [Candidula unifasciata]
MAPFPIIIFCAVVMGHAAGQNSRNNVWDLVYFISGDWTNRAQLDGETTGHDLFDSRIIPVSVPALHEETVLLLEDVINGKLFDLYLLVVTQDEKDKNLVHATRYNINVTEKYKPGKFNVDELYNLTMADIHREENCVGSYVRLSDGVFSGTCVMCGQVIGNQHPTFALTVTCDVFTMTVPLSVPVRATTIPYIFRRTGPRYPMINVPEDYLTPCDK